MMTQNQSLPDRMGPTPDKFILTAQKQLDARFSKRVAAIDANAVELASCRSDTLTETLLFAARNSSWHAKRVDSSLAAEDPWKALRKCPIMTKGDLVKQFDEICTDPELSYNRCNEHLNSDETILDESYVVMATSGTTGQSAFVALSAAELAEYQCAASRMAFRNIGRHSPGQSGLTPRVAWVGTGQASHGSKVQTDAFSHAQQNIRLSITSPLKDIVTDLNSYRPNVLCCYSSFLPVLAEQQLKESLEIQPTLIVVGAEVVLESWIRQAESIWGCKVLSNWGVTELGFLGCGNGIDEGLLLADDMYVIEFLDDELQPVAPNQLPSRILVTSLFHRTLPMIRYEISDQTTLLPTSPQCGSSFRPIALVSGRKEDNFTYVPDIHVHYVLFYDEIIKHMWIEDFRVFQTAKGADIQLLGRCSEDFSESCRKIEKALMHMGVERARVTYEIVDRFTAAAGGKVKRFLPLVSNT